MPASQLKPGLRFRCETVRPSAKRRIPRVQCDEPEHKQSYYGQRSRFMPMESTFSGSMISTACHTVMTLGTTFSKQNSSLVRVQAQTAAITEGQGGGLGTSRTEHRSKKRAARLCKVRLCGKRAMNSDWLQEPTLLSLPPKEAGSFQQLVNPRAESNA